MSGAEESNSGVASDWNRSIFPNLSERFRSESLSERDDSGALLVGSLCLRGSLHFFIERPVKPHFVFVEVLATQRTLLFFMDEQRISRQVNFLQAHVLNDSSVDASSPSLQVRLLDVPMARKGLVANSPVNKTFGPTNWLEYRVDGGPEKEIKNLKEDRFAYTIATNVLKEVSKTGKQESERFVFGFTIEKGKWVYLINDTPGIMMTNEPIGTDIPIDFSVRSEPHHNEPLGKEEFTLRPTSWDKIEFIPLKRRRRLSRS